MLVPLLSALLLVQATGADPLPKGVVARVDGLEITRQEAQARADVLIGQRFQGQPVPERMLKTLRPGVIGQALDQLIDERLLDADVRRAGIALDEADLRRALERSIRNDLIFKNQTRAQFEAELEASYGLTYDAYVADRLADPTLRRALEHAALLRLRFPAETAVDDADVRAAFDADPSAFGKPDRVRASHILIKKDPRMSPAERAAAIELAERVAALARAEGSDFAALAREHSQGPTGPAGGDLGAFPRHGGMAEPFAAAAFELEIGETSDVVETRFGWHVIRVTAKLPAYQLEFEAVEDRIREALEAERATAVRERHVAALKEQAEIVRRF